MNEKKVIGLFFIFSIPMIIVGRGSFLIGAILMGLFIFLYFSSNLRGVYRSKYKWLDYYVVFSYLFVLLGALCNFYYIGLSHDYSLWYFVFVWIAGVPVFNKLSK